MTTTRGATPPTKTIQNGTRSHRPGARPRHRPGHRPKRRPAGPPPRSSARSISLACARRAEPCASWARRSCGRCPISARSWSRSAWAGRRSRRRRVTSASPTRPGSKTLCSGRLGRATSPGEPGWSAISTTSTWRAWPSSGRASGWSCSGRPWRRPTSSLPIPRRSSAATTPVAAASAAGWPTGPVTWCTTTACRRWSTADRSPLARTWRPPPARSSSGMRSSS